MKEVAVPLDAANKSAPLQAYLYKGAFDLF